ncbi:Type 1 phosphatases regulator ypi1 [Coemansia biformis]|uniref:Type 1 phosphatases regulator n=1 Tax=Coemansia biformis TaxID=1286918 RepID=A0A9W7YH70_9FUNG|nr:Type 1 phosphatases regulator ypi1 [Coemansia biformis]
MNRTRNSEAHGHSAAGLASHGSRTIVTQAASPAPSEGVLLLRGDADAASGTEATPGASDTGERPTPRRVQWTGDTVDNEYLDKKKSKVCCIFHKQRAFGESDSDSESSSCSNSDSDSDGPNAYERVPRQRQHQHQRRHRQRHCHQHEHSE